MRRSNGTYEHSAAAGAQACPRSGWLAAEYREWIASQDALSIVLTIVLAGLALLLSVTAWHRARQAELPGEVERAQREYAAGDPHAALMTLYAYGMAMEDRLAQVEDLLMRDQIGNLWLQMRAGDYHRPADQPFPPELREAVSAVFHPEALLLAAAILSAHGPGVLAAHARALESGDAAEPEWERLERAVHHLPRTLATVAVQSDPALRDRVLALLRPAVRAGIEPCEPALAARLLPYFEGLAHAQSPAAAHAVLDAMAGEGGDRVVVELLAGSALDALAAVDTDAAERVRARLERLTGRVYAPALRASLAAALRGRLPEPNAATLL